MSAQFSAIIKDVSKLAEEGDAGAREIIENLRRQGITGRQ
jgi:hypothetical protein